MEALIVTAIVFVLLICMGADLELIVLLFLILLDLLLLAIFGFFVFCLIKLIGSRIKTVRFVRIEKNPKTVFKSAVYLIDGEEHMNYFPAETLLRKLLYSKLKDRKVLLCKNGDVFDINSLITVAAGLVLGASGAVVLLIGIISSVNFI